MKPLRLTVWQVIADTLLQHHFGLRLTDTALCEPDTLAECIANNIPPSEAINDLIDKYDLIRLDTKGIPHTTPYLGIHDELKVIFDSGLAGLLSEQNKP
ncbi:toxin-antitoxin protein [Xenorhabdus sp. PB61.4]|uniref:TA system toxin CbtA family protein n=1 Tax=Xenorhabdus sp. PB61.4 TaxID=2788940 RepID=UPI001E2FAC1B|nr:TA system toxin CbtA family protein [Xenorhabdus sp. PB61.4]MCC8366354.1 toxin-antitoxin protein [Xenorhabdus sp. PB61.4]